MATSTTLLSLAEFQDLPDNGMRHELSEGELIEMPPPKYLHSHVAHRFFEVLLEARSNTSKEQALYRGRVSLVLGSSHGSATRCLVCEPGAPGRDPAG